MTSKYIAALEIGSSRIKGIVAAVGTDGRLRPLAVEEVASGDSVRYGRIRNAREAGNLISDLVRRLENNPRVAPGRIASVFIADGGRSLLSAPSSSSISFNSEEEITHTTLERLNKEALFNLGTDRDVLVIAPRRFFVDSAEVKKIVGTFGKTVRGEFTLITQAPENRRALERIIIESAGADINRDYVTRLLAQTESALTDSDRQVGSLFIDFGAETTSLAVFREGALVFAATLPIGASNIARDLSSALSVTLDKATQIMHTKGEAIVDTARYEAADTEVAEIVGYVSSRAKEIVANVNNILEEAGYKASDFPEGAVIAGGGIMLKGFPEMIEQLIKIKVRKAAIDPSSVTPTPDIDIDRNFDVLCLAKYAAAHSTTDCLVFPAQPTDEHPESEQNPNTPPVEGHSNINHDSERLARNATMGGKRTPPADDDPNLLKDDDIDQPDNINNDTDDQELPQQQDDPNKTRLTLLEKIKKIGRNTANLITGAAIEEIENDGMDD